MIDIQPELLASASAMEPFAKELAGRERRRQQRLAQGRAKSEAEATAAAAAAIAAQAPSAAQLQVAPCLQSCLLMHAAAEQGLHRLLWCVPCSCLHACCSADVFSPMVCWRSIEGVLAQLVTYHAGRAASILWCAGYALAQWLSKCGLGGGYGSCSHRCPAIS